MEKILNKVQVEVFPLRPSNPYDGTGASDFVLANDDFGSATFILCRRYTSLNKKF
jgi:hypothetical protein